MATLLLLVIYLAFIGLGIPDSLFGTAWPAIYREFGLPISAANAVTLITSGSTVLSSLLSSKLIKKLGTGALVAISTSMTAMAILGFRFSDNLFFICLFSVPLGLGAGAIDTAQNNYVALHYGARHMNFLHCFYGVGVAISPFVMSAALESANWRDGYFRTFFLQAGIAIITILAVPLWKKAHGGDGIPQDTENKKPMSLLQMVKNSAVRATWLLFITSCGIEAICTSWGATFLVEVKGAVPDAAAKMIVLYFAGLATGRFLSGIFAKKFTPWQLIGIGCGIMLCAIIIVALPICSVAVSCAGLFFIGCGIGPIFPNLTHLTPINFGKENSASVIGTQEAMAYIGILFTPVIFGFAAQLISLEIFPYFIGAVFAVLVYGFIRLNLSVRKMKKAE